jgi:2-oxo-3-hexenedioate decarboxylase
MADIEALADRILAASDVVGSIPPITDADPSFDLAAAYAVSAAVTRRRIARGEHPVGWKIGFTNRTIWDEYNVHAPIFGPMYQRTVHEVPFNETIVCALHGLVEPRLEPEIVFRILRSPEPGLDGPALLDCIDGIAHGFEIVQSVYPGWRFKAADTVAAFALHGRNVLDGPLAALAHFISELDQRTGQRLKPGDIVTTGTVTRAFPVKAGETWSTRLFDLPLPGLKIAFR